MRLRAKFLWLGFVFLLANACTARPAARPTHAACKRAKPTGSSARTQSDAGMSTLGALPSASPPEVIGVLAGPGTENPPPDLKLYGTDLGLTYEHDGKLVLVFGDTWMTPRFVCDEPDPTNDDTMATMPLTYGGGVPELTFVTEANAPNDAARMHLMRGTTSLGLGSAKVAMTAFSDGQRELAIFARYEPTRCGKSTIAGGGVCPTDDGFYCSTRVGECTPPYGMVSYQCDAKTKTGCFPGQTCARASSQFCVDPSSSQQDGTIAGDIWSLAQDNEIGVRRPGLTVYDSVFVWPSNKFANLTARPVRSFTGMRDGNDYTEGHGALLVWGRPGFVAEDGRQAQLYLMTHRLPFAIDGEGALQFEPQYFAGLDADSGEPIWSPLQSKAKPLALDGVENGDPYEDQQILNQMSVSWLGPPIDKWVMLYGGDTSDALLYDAPCTRSTGAPGAIVMRFADHPWGPWSPNAPHLSPGDPRHVGDARGPGGILFYPGCVNKLPARCVEPDAQSTADALLPGCIGPPSAPDPGRLYGAAIIDSYTAPAGNDGLDVYWNVSTWNPYSVVLMKTTIRAPVGR
jgi:hypothetical protein